MRPAALPLNVSRVSNILRYCLVYIYLPAQYSGKTASCTPLSVRYSGAATSATDRRLPPAPLPAGHSDTNGPSRRPSGSVFSSFNFL